MCSRGLNEITRAMCLTLTMSKFCNYNFVNVFTYERYLFESMFGSVYGTLPGKALYD